MAFRESFSDGNFGRKGTIEHQQCLSVHFRSNLPDTLIWTKSKLSATLLSVYSSGSVVL